jgi:uncharacterized protein (DUF58 family)
MNHTFVTILADIAIFALVLGLPSLWIYFTVQSRGTPNPERYVAIFAVAAVAGVMLFVPAISIVATVALLAIGLARLSGHYALAGVRYERTVSPVRLFPGDEAQLTVSLTNDKILPLAWVSIVDPLWLGVLLGRRRLGDLLHFSSGIESMESFEHALVVRGAVGPFQTFKRSYRVTALHRGVYTLGSPRLASGDPFGIFQRETVVDSTLEIIVYPQIYAPDELGLPLREAMGEMVKRRALIEDPVLIAGSREYRPGDPLRRVHWKATAQTGELQVRVSDASTTAKLMLVLNLTTSQRGWQGIGIERMEAAIQVAGSLAVWALDHDFAVGLHSNGVMAGVDTYRGDDRVAPSASKQQAAVLLEHLARLSFPGRSTAQWVLMDEARRLREGTSIIFVTSIITPELIAVLTSRQLRHRVSVVYCGRSAAPVVPGVPIYLAAPRETSRAVS